MEQQMTGTTEQVFRVTGMDCAACATNVEIGVGKLNGVETSMISFTTEVLRVSGNIPAETIIARVRELGYDVGDPAESADAASDEAGSFLQFMWSRANTRLALLGALLVLPGLLFNELLPMLGLEHPLLDLTSVAAMLVAGYPIGVSAWKAVKINHDININVLMSIAAIGAVIIGAYSEAGLVMVLFALGEALEGFTAAKARDAIRGLMDVAPNQATVLRPCIDCAGHLGQDGYTGGPCPVCGLEEHRVETSDLKIGERIVVKPGERIPMDGRIISGISSVDQAPITGESKLIPKKQGDTVFASAINGEGSLEIEVTHLAADNTISRLIRMVEEAQEKRAPTQRFVDRFARTYTPAVVLLAILVAAVPPLFFGQLFWNSDAGAQGWLYRALALLVVACPCALVISTPVTVISAISNGARNGVLFKGGSHLEALSRVKAIAFDKTGTLTLGKPEVVSVRSVACSTDGVEICDNCDDLLALATAVERRSEHPLAHAVIAESASRGVQDRYPTAELVTAMAGLGVRGSVGGRQVTIGSHTYFDDHIPHDSHCQTVANADAQGFTTLLVSDESSYAGYIAVTDGIRPSSPAAIQALKTLGIDNLVMLTGDNLETAQRVAAEVGVTDVMANCLPQEKVKAVESLRQRYTHVAMVGDGINDTPALATATVGIAIGSTAQAMETADITLMGDDLRQLSFALRLSRSAMNVIRANVALSLAIKFAFVILVILGLGSMWLAVFADVGTSILVTLNGMRLISRPKPDWSS